MKKILVMALVAIFLGATSAGAALIPYWTLSDTTATGDGTANLAITFNNANNQNIEFGLFDPDDALTSIENSAGVFQTTDDVGWTATASFDETGGGMFDLMITVRDALNAVQRVTVINDFDTTFGFYYNRDTNPDRTVYSDPQFNDNVGGNTMFMVPDFDSDQVGVQLLFTGSPIYNVSVSDVTPIPEPATMMLIGLGLIGVAGIRRKMS